MARSFNGSSEYTIQAGGSNFNGYPMTVACWGMHSSLTTGGWPFEVTAETVGNRSLALGFRGDTGGDPTQYRYANTSVGASNSTGGFSVDTWTHLCAVSASSTSHILYTNGADAVTTTTSVTHPNVPSAVQGCFYDSNARSQYLGGKTMHCAVWGAALTADEVAGLAKGFSPRRIRPQSLIFYDPGIRTLRDLKGFKTSHTDAASFADQHRCYGL